MLAYNFASTGESGKLRHLFQRDMFSSDDSDDSDYTGEETSTTTTAKKRKSPSEPGGKRRKRRKKSKFKVPDEKKKRAPKKSFPKHPCRPHRNTWASLPSEVLINIFNHLVIMDKGARFLTRCTQVCSHWSDVASQSISWQGTVDFSFMCGNKRGTDELLEKLCSTKLVEIKGIDLRGWTFISKKGISSVAKHCQKLEYFNLSHCKSRNPKITAENIIEISTNLPLRDVNLSSTNILGGNLLTMINLCGKNLKNIDFSENISLFSSIFSGIYKHCANLEVLNLSNTSVRSICFITLQKSCPKLQELYLANLDLDIKPSSLNIDNGSIDNPGFTDLKILSLAKSSDDGFASYSDNLIQMILRSSCELNVLDLRGNRYITEAGLQFPSMKVERLFLSRTKVSTKSIIVISERWHDVLWDLDLSWNDIAELDSMINLLLTCDHPCRKLKNINLAGSCITNCGVKTILLTCLDLKWLDLSSCRGVNRGNKRCHDGIKAIEALKNSYDI